jgi:hypothetical protein
MYGWPSASFILPAYSNAKAPSVPAQSRRSRSFPRLRPLHPTKFHLVTRDKIKDIKIEFWTDDSRTNALCTMAFKGWLSSWHISGGGGSNHILSVSIQPTTDQKNYHDLQLGN